MLLLRNPPPLQRWGLVSMTMLALAAPPSSPSSSSSVPSCPSAGFHPDPVSCSSFLRCTGPGKGHRYLCPAGTRYDPSISNCNHLALAPPCNLPSPIPSTSTPSSTPSSTTPSPTTTPPTVPSTSVYPSSTPIASSSSPTPTGEVEEEGVSETDSAESVTGAGEGGEGFGEGDEGAAGGSTGGGEGSQGEEEGQIAEEETQEEPNEGENGGVEESLRPNGNVTDQGEDGGEEEGSNYLVAAGSAYPCPDPGYFSLTGSCTEFWVCKEVGPGLLSAERPFRCPKRYLFDPITRLCQREAKVKCKPSLFYSLASTLAIQLREEQLEAFFSSPLTLASATSHYPPRLAIFPSPLPLLSPVHHRPPHAGMFYWMGK